VLGLIGEKAELIEPASCIGHGACKTACPADAISLVFGTATRGVEIPHLAPNFETNVAGIFIAGELGGMGLIANAVEQGRQAIRSIARLDGPGGERRHPLDVVIVGAGPAGIAASLAAREQGLRSVTLEQESFGGTVAHYPRGKVVMTRPGLLPLHGRFGFRRVRKERLLALWADVVQRHRLPIRYGERVERIRPLEGDGYLVQTAETDYRARAVLLATGRRGSPRKLGVPGEGLGKVAYSLMSPEQYRGRHVLVVGGGDSALEAATALAVEGVAVTLSYRGSAFTRAKPASRKRLEAALARGRVQLMLESRVVAIHPDRVDIAWGGRVMPLRNDAVIICAGGVLPGAFLRSIGIAVEKKYGTP
jgi:thioredoxin reductase